MPRVTPFEVISQKSGALYRQKQIDLVVGMLGLYWDIKKQALHGQRIDTACPSDVYFSNYGFRSRHNLLAPQQWA